MEDSTTAGFRSIRCPFCEVYELERTGEDSARCNSCRGFLDAQLLSTLREILTLPEALGAHPCEDCGHPQMRRLPDGVFHCSACRSEVMPASGSVESCGSKGVSEAYLSGWMDGLVGSSASLIHDRELGRWEDSAERLDYYCGHRVGREAFPKTNWKWQASMMWKGMKRLWTLLTTEEVFHPDGTNERRTVSRQPRG